MARIYVSVGIDTDNLIMEGENDAFELIKAVDDQIATIEFTRRVYEYARDLLINEGETL